ncbi:hypothetical protein [Candidatus Ichthyocystis hellenicum]|nr:hypothetical protein [Candidatus Ichthyocystis hellenicum]
MSGGREREEGEEEKGGRREERREGKRGNLPQCFDNPGWGAILSCI